MGCPPPRGQTLRTARSGHDKVRPSRWVATGSGPGRRSGRLVVEVLVVGRTRLVVACRSRPGPDTRRLLRVGRSVTGNPKTYPSRTTPVSPSV